MMTPMFVRRSLFTLLLVGLVWPSSGAVLCVEPDGRVEVEVGIGGRCADMVMAVHSEAPTFAEQCGSCRDTQLRTVGSTASRKERLSDPGDAAMSAPERTSVYGPFTTVTTGTKPLVLPGRQLEHVASTELRL